MEFSFRKLYESSWSFRPCGKELSFGDKVKKFSQETSRYPDPEDGCPLILDFNRESLRNASDALSVLCLIPLVSYVPRDYFQIEALRNHIWAMASNYRFEGEWKLVSEILRTTTSQDIYSTWRQVLPFFSEEDWFGNFLPKMYNMLNGFKYKRAYRKYQNPDDLSHREKHKGIKRTIRRRGYRDKGSRRPPHSVPIGRELSPTELERHKEIEVLRRGKPKEPRPFAWFSGSRGKYP